VYAGSVTGLPSLGGSGAKKISSVEIHGARKLTERRRVTADVHSILLASALCAAGCCLAAVASSCSEEQGRSGDGCEKDDDCKGDRICSGGECVDAEGTDGDYVPSSSSTGSSGDDGGLPDDGGAASSSTGSDGGTGGYCPFPPSTLSCSTACANELVHCQNQCDGDALCAYGPSAPEGKCVSDCEYSVHQAPDSFFVEVFGCWQLTTDCAAHTQCLLDSDCDGAL